MFSICSFYCFSDLSNISLQLLKKRLTEEANSLNVKGLILLATEGVNATVAGSQEDLKRYFTACIEQIPALNEAPLKWSQATFNPFKRFKIDLRKELITSSTGILLSESLLSESKVQATKLSPKEWHEKLTEQNGKKVLIDTRNTYETSVGAFKGAIVPPLEKFSDFLEYVRKEQFPKDSDIMMYCTGGIRCEKAAIELLQEGYSNVFQLEGGILKYLEEYPQGEFEGECYVFDHRVAVKPDLTPSDTFSLCPLCGDPADQLIECENCGLPKKLCPRCTEKSPVCCSKNCRNIKKKKLSPSIIAKNE